MASRRSSVAIVACTLLVVACTRTGTATDPTAPPDVFASTPTIGDFSPATTAGPVPTRPPEIERTEILPVDPLSLEPLPGYDPIPMGDWMWGQPSPASGYLAALVGSNRGTSEVRLIDLANWQVVGLWAQSPESGLLVTDDGTVYLAGSGQFQRLRLGDTVPEEVARLPAGFQPWSMSPLFDQALVAFGTRLQTGESASIVSIDVTSGMMSEIELPDVQVGPLDPESYAPDVFYVNPFPVFDIAGNRVLIVHGDADVISEIDLTTGTVSRHEFDSGDPAAPTLERSASMSPEGSILYVSGRKMTGNEVSGGSRTVTIEPVGVIAIDTATWEVRSQSDEPIANIMLSPGGNRILGWGFSTVEGDTVYQASSSGVFVLDAPNLTVLSRHHADEESVWYTSFSFNAEGDIGYASGWGQEARLESIDLTSGDIVASLEGGDNLYMIGSIGILHADAGAFTP